MSGGGSGNVSGEAGCTKSSIERDRMTHILVVAGGGGGVIVFPSSKTMCLREQGRTSCRVCRGWCAPIGDKTFLYYYIFIKKEKKRKKKKTKKKE